MTKENNDIFHSKRQLFRHDTANIYHCWTGVQAGIQTAQATRGTPRRTIRRVCSLYLSGLGHKNKATAIARESVLILGLFWSNERWFHCCHFICVLCIILRRSERLCPWVEGNLVCLFWTKTDENLFEFLSTKTITNRNDSNVTKTNTHISQKTETKSKIATNNNTAQWQIKNWQHFVHLWILERKGSLHMNGPSQVHAAHEFLLLQASLFHFEIVNMVYCCKAQYMCTV